MELSPITEKFSSPPSNEHNGGLDFMIINIPESRLSCLDNTVESWLRGAEAIISAYKSFSAKRYGVCSTDLRLYTSTNGLKQVYTSLEAIYWKTYFLKNVHLKISYNF
jgi:hypothetical protein